MNSPALAIAWQLWHPRRWTAAGYLVGLLLLALAARWVAHGAADWRTAVFMWCIPFGFTAVGMLSAFALPEGDLLAPASGYPPRMFTLPVSSRELVLWPMLHGVAIAALTWVAFARLVLFPLGANVALAWPAALVAGCVTWVQALLWVPLGLRYVRPLLAVTLIPAWITTVIQLAMHGVSAPQLTVLCSCAALAAYPVAVVGIGAARRGGGPTFQLRRRTARSERYKLAGAGWFQSPFRAQLWFELRSSAAGLPIVVGGLFLLMSLPFLWCRELAPLSPFQVEGEPGIRVNLWLTLLQSSLFFLPLFGGIAGCGQRGSGAFPVFLATRPLSPGMLLAARFLSAAVSCLAAWAIALVFVSGWLLLPAQAGTDTGPLFVLALHEATPRGWGVVAGVLLLLVFWTWKCQIQGAWPDLTGRRWVAVGVPYLIHSLVLVATLTLVTRIQASLHGDHHSLDLLRELPKWLTTAAVGKAVAGLLMAAYAVRTQVVTWRGALGLAIGWLVLTAGLFGLLLWMVRIGSTDVFADGVLRIYVPFCSSNLAPQLHSPAALAAIAVLFLPFSRLLAAPIALSLHRKR